ncbi:hypothetical protein SAMN05428966_101322 [Massilia sp. PDC64]|nr:hypothetical protein [Massilia sp. PDC64]SDC22444.1 hypothetical protein SAMN05428966_101322 [Massilia sp. PDC64]
MIPGLTIELSVAALCIFTFGVFVASRLVSLPAALFTSAVKVLIALIYFSFFFNPDWALIDGINYFRSGRELLAAGYTPISVFDADAVIESMAAAGGHHVLYDWYNVLSQWVFGDFYASAVFMNIGLTFVSAYLLCRIVELLGFPSTYRNGLFIFFSLHWELLSWTSLTNLKDTLVLTLTVTSFYAGIKFAKFRRPRQIIWIVILLFLFYWIRFYVPLLMITAVLIWSLSMLRGRRQLFIVLGVLIAVAAYGTGLGWDGVSEGLGRLSLGADMLIGTIRVIVVPRPWGIEPEYEFLTIAAALHWIFVVPTILGVWMLWRTTPQLRPLFIYLGIIFLFYGAFEELQGSRQRIQVLFIYALAQYHFMWCLLHYISRTSSATLMSRK